MFNCSATRSRMPLPVRAVGLLLTVVLASSACSRGDEAPAAGPQAPAESATAQREVSPNWREDRQDLGKSTYEAVCASCHDTGAGGAPRTGEREDWQERSDLWQAVLFNHAKSGYLDMPEMGGNPELSDEAVEAAAEYMLGLTFPELPED